MKKLCKKELTSKEWNEALKEAVQKLNQQKNNRFILAVSAVGILALVCALMFVITKRREQEDMDEFEDWGCEDDCCCDKESDENGSQSKDHQAK